MRLHTFEFPSSMRISNDLDHELVSHKMHKRNKETKMGLGYLHLSQTLERGWYDSNSHKMAEYANETPFWCLFRCVVNAHNLQK